MSEKRSKNMQSVVMGFARASVFVACGTIAFLLGVKMTNDIEPVASSVAQALQTTQVNVILQYQPVDGSAPRPIEITPFMNGSQNALLQFHDVHTNTVEPGPAQRCKTTNASGRCDVFNIPVGPNPNASNVDRQYDIIVDTVLIETLTNIPISEQLAFVRFDQSKCSGSSITFTGDTWCMTKPGGNFAPEYFMTIMLHERDVCMEIAPPTPLCSGNDITTFSCNPQFSGPTNPWQDVTNACDPAQCPDGNTVSGKCDAVFPGLAACSTAAACTNNQLCLVQNFNSSIFYNAGADTIVVSGERFGAMGGTVSFPRAGGGREVVRVSAGSNWTNTEIRVAVPQNAITGTLKIHPNTHGFLMEQSGLEPVTCASPAASIRPFTDQFVILGISARSPDGIALVSPGFDTQLTLLVRHNDAVSRLDKIAVELTEGAFTDPENLPLNRILITQASCPVEITGSAQGMEAILECAVPIPQSAGQFLGPFTYIVTLSDTTGGSARAVLLAGGTSALIGDFSLDGVLSLEDAVLALRIVSGTIAETDEHLVRDTNNDGSITRDDVLFVLHSLTQ